MSALNWRVIATRLPEDTDLIMGFDAAGLPVRINASSVGDKVEVDTSCPILTNLAGNVTFTQLSDIMTDITTAVTGCAAQTYYVNAPKENNLIITNTHATASINVVVHEVEYELYSDSTAVKAEQVGLAPGQALSVNMSSSILAVNNYYHVVHAYLTDSEEPGEFMAELQSIAPPPS